MTGRGRWWTVVKRPRIEPLRRSELSWVAKIVLALIRRRTRSRDFNVHRTLARLGGIFPAHTMLLSQILRDGHLQALEKELIILRVAWRSACRYEWGHHRRMARELGASAAELDAVARESPAGLSPRMTAALRAVDQLLAHRVLDDATWQATSQELSHDAILELCVVVGHYVMVAMTLDSVGIELEDEFLDELDALGDGQ
jgi:AhpD family alkylhydroperoxidase